MSTNKTKDWLKNQLVSHGIPLPSSTAKKEEYQRLYDEQVLPRQSNNSEFSSDDDTEEVSIPRQDTPTRSPSVNNSRPDTKIQNGTDGSSDKREDWVHKLSDKNLFTALKANGREVGGIVASTRALYQNMLLDLLKKDEKKVISDIEKYLSQNDDARTFWLEDGVEMNGGLNGVNGNSENGFSDTDDDEALETASRASRSSRASSKRSTPLRSSIASAFTKESTPTHRTQADTNVRPSGRMTGVIHEELDGVNEIASSSRSHLTTTDSLLYNRVSSPSDSPLRYNSKPYTMRKTVVETVEKTRTHVYDEDSSEETQTQPRQRSVPPKAGSPKFLKLFYYVLLLIVVIAGPYLAYYIYNQPSSGSCEGSGCAPTDELDKLLESLDNEPGVA